MEAEVRCPCSQPDLVQASNVHVCICIQDISEIFSVLSSLEIQARIIVSPVKQKPCACILVREKCKCAWKDLLSSKNSTQTHTGAYAWAHMRVHVTYTQHQHIVFMQFCKHKQASALNTTVWYGIFCGHHVHMLLHVHINQR